MTWTAPPYTAQFSLPLVWQLFGIIQRDSPAAFAYYETQTPPTLELEQIKTYVFSPRKIEAFPALRISPVQEPFDQQAVGSLHYVAQLEVWMRVINQDPDVVAILMQKYTQAMNSILNQWSTTNSWLSDFYTALQVNLPWVPGGTLTTIPLSPGSVKDVRVTHQSYSDIGSRGTSFSQASLIMLEVEREEPQSF